MSSGERVFGIIVSAVFAAVLLTAVPVMAQDDPDGVSMSPRGPGDPGFIADSGDPGWRILTERCPGAVNDRETCKQCLSGVVGSGVDASTDVNEIIEGTLLLPRILEGREDRPSQEPKKVFMYHRFAVDENGVIYAPGELG